MNERDSARQYRSDTPSRPAATPNRLASAPVVTHHHHAPSSPASRRASVATAHHLSSPHRRTSAIYAATHEKEEDHGVLDVHNASIDQNGFMADCLSFKPSKKSQISTRIYFD